MAHLVTTKIYSGPFDLLLSLVSRQKLDIAAIPIAEIADQFLEELERMQEMDLEVTSDFILVAATLLDIKAKNLVSDPQENFSFDPDDEFTNLDPYEARDVLIERLIRYRQFRNVSNWLYSRANAEARMFFRTCGPDPEFLGLMPDFFQGITLRSLGVICADLTSRRQKFLLEASHIAPQRVPVRIAVESVMRSIRNARKTKFSELVGASKTPQDVIVTFLAVLELYKREIVEAYQEDNFADIELSYVGEEKDTDRTSTSLTSDLADLEEYGE